MSTYSVSLQYVDRNACDSNVITHFTGGIPQLLSVPGVPPISVRATRNHERSGPDTTNIGQRFCQLEIELEVENGMLDSPGTLLDSKGNLYLMPGMEPEPLWGPLRWAWRETLGVTPMQGSHIYKIQLRADVHERVMDLRYEVTDIHGVPYVNDNGAQLVVTLRASIE